MKKQPGQSDFVRINENDDLEKKNCSKRQKEEIIKYQVCFFLNIELFFSIHE